MFANISRAVVSFLLLATAVSAAPVDGLAARQGSCLSFLTTPNASNNIGRVSFQRNIDERVDGTYLMNNAITVHILPPEDIATTRQLRVRVTNSGTTSNTVLLSNYLNTLTSTQPREQIRINIGPQATSNGVTIVGTSNVCMTLPRLDGTWYIQLER